MLKLFFVQAFLRVIEKNSTIKDRARNGRDYLGDEAESGRGANRRAELVLIGLERYVEDADNCPALATQ